jgi:hypothetical protein
MGTKMLAEWLTKLLAEWLVVVVSQVQLDDF